MDDSLWNDYEHEYDDGRENTTCKHCGRYVEWEMTPAGWRLFEDGALHVCFDPFEIAKEVERESTLVRKTKRNLRRKPSTR